MFYLFISFGGVLNVVLRFLPRLRQVSACAGLSCILHRTLPRLARKQGFLVCVLRGGLGQHFMPVGLGHG